MSAARTWQLLTTPLASTDSPWELFHENSKAAPHEPFLPDAACAAYLAQMTESLPYDGCREVVLPAARALEAAPLHESLMGAASTEIEACIIPLDAAASLLRYGYGNATWLHPLELYIHAARVTGLEPGLYHYDPARHSLQLLRGGDQTQKLAPALVDGRIAMASALTIFIAAMPERAVLKYGDRGYRLALLEAGIVARNMGLTAAAMGLAALNVIEYYDRDVDELLALDGLTISTMQIVAIGRNPVGDGANRRPD